jgi:hypothetical protein
MSNPPAWSLSHSYMWLPLLLLVASPCLFIIGKIIVRIYRERRDRNLLYDGRITVNEYRRRRGVKSQ